MHLLFLERGNYRSNSVELLDEIVPLLFLLSIISIVCTCKQVMCIIAYKTYENYSLIRFNHTKGESSGKVV